MSKSAATTRSDIEALKAQLAATQAELNNAKEENQELHVALNSAPRLTQFEKNIIKQAEQARARQEKIAQDKERYDALFKEGAACYYAEGNSRTCVGWTS